MLVIGAIEILKVNPMDMTPTSYRCKICKTSRLYNLYQLKLLIIMNMSLTIEEGSIGGFSSASFKLYS